MNFVDHHFHLRIVFHATAPFSINLLKLFREIVQLGSEAWILLRSLPQHPDPAAQLQKFAAFCLRPLCLDFQLLGQTLVLRLELCQRS